MFMKKKTSGGCLPLPRGYIYVRGASEKFEDFLNNFHGFRIFSSVIIVYCQYSCKSYLSNLILIG